MKREGKIGIRLGTGLILLIGISLVAIGEPKSVTIGNSIRELEKRMTDEQVLAQAGELKSEVASYHQDVDQRPQAVEVETLEETQTTTDIDGINDSVNGPIALLWVAGSLIVVIGLLTRFS